MLSIDITCKNCGTLLGRLKSSVVEAANLIADKATLKLASCKTCTDNAWRKGYNDYMNEEMEIFEYFVKPEKGEK